MKCSPMQQHNIQIVGIQWIITYKCMFMKQTYNNQMKSQRINKHSKQQGELNPQGELRSERAHNPTISDFLQDRFPTLDQIISMLRMSTQNKGNHINTQSYGQQKNGPQDSETESKIIYGQCGICIQPIHQNQDLLTLSSNCNHIFCKKCLDSYLRSRFAGLMPIICPQEGCSQPYSKNTKYFQALQPQFKKQCQRVQLAIEISKDASKKLCPSQACDFGVINIQKNKKIAKCDKCATEFCIGCMMKKHKGDCDKTQVNYLQNELKFKKCRKCRMVVERSQGCSHMTCICGHQFCYMCGHQFTFEHECSSFFNFFEDFPQPLRIVFKIIIMPLFILGLILLVILLICVSLAIGIIGGSTVGPFILIRKICEKRLQVLAALAIVFFPVTAIAAIFIGTIAIFFLVLDKCIYAKAKSTFYAIKQM